MGRPYQEKYADVFWEEDVDGKVLEAWKEGKTGFPIVDAAMRQCKTQGIFFARYSFPSKFSYIHRQPKPGYMHNRARMIAAMFFTKVTSTNHFFSTALAYSTAQGFDA